MIVTAESFLLFANPLPEPMLLVSSSRIILAVNNRCAERFEVGHKEWVGKSMFEISSDDPEELSHYLDLCARTRQLVLGAISVRGREDIECRAEGCLVSPASGSTDAVVMLRLIPKEAAVGQFLALNLRIEELDREMQRRKDAEQRARENAERLEITLAGIGERERQFVTLAESIPQLSWMAHPDGRIFWYNRRWYDYTGSTLEDMEGWGWQRVHDPTTLPEVLDRWKESIASGRSFNMTFPLRGNDGEFRPFLTKVEPIKDDEGRVVRWFGTNTDVSEQVFIEKHLRASEANYRLIVEGTPALICRFLPDGTLTFVNDTYCRTFGKTRDELIGHRFIPLVPEEDRGVFERLLQQLAPDMPPLTHDHRVVVADGTLRWQQWTNAAVIDRDGEFHEFQAYGIDITDRKQAEEQLRFQRDLTRYITDAATTAIFTVDDQGRCTFMNPAAEAMTGFTFAEVSGHILHNRIHHHRQDGREYLAEDCPVHSVLPANGELQDHEDVFIRKSGELFPVLVNARIIQQERLTVGTVFEVRDVTNERRADAALRESERRYRLVGEAANDTIWDWDVLTNHVTWNDGLHRTFGYDADRVGSDFSWWIARVHPDDRARVLHDIAAAMTGDASTRSTDYRFQRADESYAHVFDRSRIVRAEGRAIRMVGSLLDLTERQVAEAALRERTEQLNFTLAATGIGMWLNRLPLGTLDWDARTKELFHLDANDEPTIELFWSRIHPDDREPTRIAIDAALRNGSLYVIEHRILHPHTGDVRWVRSMGQATYGENGTPSRFDGINYDVSDRKRLEEELRSTAAELSEADRKKDEFLATLAHELRNPLAPIRNALELIRLAEGNWATVEQARTLIDRQLIQMVRLVDDLMDVSRIATGKVQLRIERVSVASALLGAVESARPLIDRLEHDLTVILPEHALFVDADSTRLSQVFLNLLTNAAKYSERNGAIWVTARPSGHHVVVSVKDAGIGISAEQLPKIFGMFSQVDRSLERSQGGLGIGLSLVKQLVEMHGGTVEASSDGLGRGAEFIVHLPLAADTATPSVADGPRDQSSSALRILVVDDNRDSADSLASMLRMVGNEVHIAYDGEEAVLAADSLHPHVILLDIGLPKLNGHETCRQIRGLPRGEEIVIIAQTGWGQEEDRRQTEAFGFDHHLVKPIDTQVLMSLLRSLSDRPSRAVVASMRTDGSMPRS